MPAGVADEGGVRGADAAAAWPAPRHGEECPSTPTTPRAVADFPGSLAGSSVAGDPGCSGGSSGAGCSAGGAGCEQSTEGAAAAGCMPAFFEALLRANSDTVITVRMPCLCGSHPIVCAPSVALRCTGGMPLSRGSLSAYQCDNVPLPRWLQCHSSGEGASGMPGSFRSGPAAGAAPSLDIVPRIGGDDAQVCRSSRSGFRVTYAVPVLAARECAGGAGQQPAGTALSHCRAGGGPSWGFRVGVLGLGFREGF